MGEGEGEPKFRNLVFVIGDKAAVTATHAVKAMRYCCEIGKMAEAEEAVVCLYEIPVIAERHFVEAEAEAEDGSQKVS